VVYASDVIIVKVADTTLPALLILVGVIAAIVLLVALYLRRT
jgi:hypothetical protein